MGDNSRLPELRYRRDLLLVQIKKGERETSGYLELGLNKRAEESTQYVGKKMGELGLITIEISAVQSAIGRMMLRRIKRAIKKLTD